MKTVESEHQDPTSGPSAQARSFLLHFLKLQIPMMLGALICYLLGLLIPASSNFAAAYHPGTYLSAAGDILFLTVPVVVWMVVRGHSWQDGLGIAIAMIAPVAVIMMVGQLAAYDYLTWLLTAGYPAMSLGMLIYMLYRRDHFTRRMAHSRRTAVEI